MTPGEDEALGRFVILWSSRACDDLAAIAEHIAADNPAAALRWLDRLIADVERAAAMSLAGRVVPEYADRRDIREVLRRTYRIVYRVHEGAIQVLTIFEGHRLFPEDVVPDNNGD